MVLKDTTPAISFCCVQRNRISGTDEGSEVAVTPSGLETFGVDAHVGRGLPAQQVQGAAPTACEPLGRLTTPRPTLSLPAGGIAHSKPHPVPAPRRDGGGLYRRRR
jgi:hypothetical protein